MRPLVKATRAAQAVVVAVTAQHPQTSLAAQEKQIKVSQAATESTAHSARAVVAVRVPLVVTQVPQLAASVVQVYRHPLTVQRQVVAAVVADSAKAAAVAVPAVAVAAAQALHHQQVQRTQAAAAVVEVLAVVA